MQRSRRVGSAIAVATAGLLALSACGGGGAGGGGGDSVTLNMLVPGYSDNTKGLWEGVISDFQAANAGITINLEVVSWDDLDSVVTTKIQGGQAPDIYNGGDYSSFVADELLYPIDQVVGPDTLADFQPSFVPNASIDGVQYGAPLIASARALFVNTELLQQAGISAAPTTWDELKTAATAISGLGGGVAGYGLPLGSEEAQAEAAVWFYGGGGGYGDETTLTIDSPENIAAAQFVKGLIDAGATQADPGATDRSPLMDVFVQGKIGMQIGLPPTVGQIADNNPELKYEIVPIPTKDGSPVTLGVADHLVAFDNGDDAKQAAITTFFDYFFSADVYTNWVTTEGFLPTTVSGGEALASDEALAPFLELLPDAKFYPSANPNWQAAANAMKTNFGLIATQDPATVLQKIQTEAEAG
ncbi:extracellular solute-binding protein [Pseudoclavibacter chungangensis]|uniref:Extracellular solute-binding protein n=1 Tax=Pseudoclavibacter chungangensis TaxID=587635 RepID=A0A7J5BPD4_9MICO|nr:extracellular solute-binding protein [Pseudoclavibacter chungangensis]KAB1654797.1 extracellular solute-binding protein [Pseudoclavibacter chungangensis]NYJ68088.1 multiple sugar transport system substrate-binding protein [Pseudoclavibacter chungangensis]